MRGQVSVDFVEILRQRFEGDRFQFVNAGVNGDLAFNVLLRLDAVVALQPDFVIVLVGTNDVNATLSPAVGMAYRLCKRLPQDPSVEWYRRNMVQIVRLLARETSARIAVASPPVLGEDLASSPNERIRAYSSLLMQIAFQEGIAYLPVHERQEEYLRTIQGAAGRPHEATSMIMWTSILRHYLFRQSLDTIARQNRFLLTTEGLHLNAVGAAIVADTVEPFLRSAA